MCLAADVRGQHAGAVQGHPGLELRRPIVMDLTSFEVAAWVQALGGVAAIGSGFLFVNRQVRADRQRQRYVQALLRRERLKAASQLVAAVKRIVERARTLARVAPDPPDAEDSIDLFVTELQVVGDAIRKFDVSLFTSHVPIEALLVTGSLARLLATRLADDTFRGGTRSVRHNLSLLDVAIGELEERISRLSGLLGRPRDI